MISLSDLKIIRRNQSQILRRWWSGKRASDFDTDSVVKKILQDHLTTEERCNILVDYFWTGQIHYSTMGATRAYYPGMPSIYGANNDGIEGVARLMPLWAVQTINANVSKQDKEKYTKYLVLSLLNGTNPNHSGYWGKVNDKSTLICEAPDIALALWLVKDNLWMNFSTSEQQQILAWLKQIPFKETADNNWHLFVVLVAKIIETLEPDSVNDARLRYERVKSFYLGEGCFRDGPNGMVDLYNAWGFHYALYWIDQVDPHFDRAFIQQAICDYSQWFQLLFTESGFPLFGRSLCYKAALPVPLLAASDYEPERFSPDVTKTILDSTLRFIVANGGLVEGRMSQGVFDDDETWLDPYSGPASAFWGTRSLVMYYFVNRKSDRAESPLVELPYHQVTETLKVNASNMQIKCNTDKGTVTLRFLDNDNYFDAHMLHTPSLKDKLRGVLFGVAQRPANNLQKLGINRFDSDLAYYRKKRANL